MRLKQSEQLPAQFIPLPAEAQYVVTLDGTWRFKLEQAPKPPRFLGVSGRPIPIVAPAALEPFYRTDYREDGQWQDMAVPGNWEMAGASPATYHQPDNASAFYRRHFFVPREWHGRVVKLNFDGVQNGCAIWCNGRPVPVSEPSGGRLNYHESGWTAWQADLTEAVEFGKTNLLALHVTKNTKTVECDTGDYFLLGGVYRPVTLFAVPEEHFRDITIRTKLLAGGRAEVTVLAQVGGAAAGGQVRMLLEGQKPVEMTVGADGLATLSQEVSQPRLWSAEFPNLYKLSLALKDKRGRVVESLTRRIGIREVSITNGIFCVNGVPVKLVGICRHDLSPTLGTAVDRDIWKKDLTLMKAANFNAIRTSHYPYGSGFYDLCDELGFYVVDEEPFCWVDCTNTNLLAGFAQRARETVARDKNHPCVVIWAVGNENNTGTNNTVAAQITRQMDPTRPRLISNRRSDEHGVNVEFDDRHYVTPQRIREDAQSPRRARWPMIYMENPNVWDVRNGMDYGSLDLWGEVQDRTWQEVWADDHITGSFLWEWQDRGVADKCPTKYYSYYPRSGINIIKVKGVVDAFRNPRPEYYHVKMSQAPIVVGASPEVLPGAVVLEVTNRYSFTDLGRLRVQWALSGASGPLSEGTARLSLPPRSHGPIRLRLPAKALVAADTLRLAFEHPGGWNIGTWQLFLKAVAHPVPEVQPVEGVRFPRFNLVTGKNVDNEVIEGWHHLERKTGELVDVRVQKTDGSTTVMDAKGLAATLFHEVRAVEAKVVLNPGASPVGQLHAEATNGMLKYHLTWTGGTNDVFELGWIFNAPKGLERFSWERKARWSWYPPDHIGRPVGTATPDSANVELTRVDRRDAFDFNSTKFDCNWASLTDAQNRGLCLVFSPEQRQHVRGILDADGTCGLVVNRCYSPPRDISSDVVPELYTVLKPNDQVIGSFQCQGIASPSPGSR